VLSTIIARIRGERPDMPLVVSYDESERVNNPPMPLPFQWPCQMTNRTISERSLCQYLNHALAAIGIIDASGRPLRYTFHDFRRLVHHRRDHARDATPHRQLVAGHRDINATMGYNAIGPGRPIKGHRAFIARHRELRPSQDYRTPSDEE
jgi:YD repeat-containing protein